ncbi:MAG TPA: SRPBCC domain-containing protein [Solirubrobacteraceae bacterium]
MTDPLRLSFTVACPPAHAFATWTERMTMWWPRSHTVHAGEDLEVVFEPRAGGRIFERTASGAEADWGEVVAWEPPRRVVYLWHLRQDRADATEVELAFAPDAAGTRVDIEHRGWERLGARGPERRQANERGWGGVLPAFTAACLGYS